MTTKQDLERLLTDCEECSGNDDRSYEEHFADCPDCKKYEEAAEHAGEQIQFLEGLASRPYESGKQILGAHMRKFLGLSKDERKHAISDLMDALGEVSEYTRLKSIKMRTDIMM